MVDTTLPLGTPGLNHCDNNSTRQLAGQLLLGQLAGQLPGQLLLG